MKLAAGEAYTTKKPTTESKKSIQNKPLDLLLAVSISVINLGKYSKDLASFK